MVVTSRPVISEPGGGADPADPAHPPVSELRLDRVSVRYRLGRGRDHPALRQVSLSVKAGEWLAVIGPNGSGKSTLLKAMAGIVDHEGSIEAVGAHRRGPDPSARHRGRLAAYVPQTPVFPPGLTTAEYVLVGRTSHLRWYQFESAQDRALVVEALDELDLGELADRPVAELSGGEAQRVALARAIVQQAPVLLLDEPISALDLAHQLAVLELIDRLRERYQLIVVSSFHDLTAAGRHADKVLLLDRGRPAVHGRPDEILRPDLLSDHYGVEITVLPDPSGGVIVVPTGPPTPPRRSGPIPATGAVPAVPGTQNLMSEKPTTEDEPRP